MSFPITIKTLPIQSEPVDIPMFICVIVILFYLIYKLKRVTKPNDETVVPLVRNFNRMYLFPTP